ncbi:MAG TPA: aminoglycoside phosphotransferase family protein [Actinotalea sp.]
MTTQRSTAPAAFGGSRLGWADLPRHVRRRIVELTGAEVISETSATSGFSPGFAGVLELGDGTEVFVKAVSAEQNPESPELARSEIEVARHLPAAVPAPRMRWSDDDGTWVILAFDAVSGRSPELPWHPEDLERVLGALTQLAEAGRPAAGLLRPLAKDMAAMAQGWDLLADDAAALTRARLALAPHGDWLADNLGRLQGWAADAVEACQGDHLVHGDLRADNVMLAPDTVWLIDWPHAAGNGAGWYDLLTMLPSVAMQAGGDPAEIFWSQPTTRGADRDAVRAVLAGISGYFVHGAVQPAPTGITNLRAFQTAQGIEALDWLRRF